MPEKEKNYYELFALFSPEILEKDKEDIKEILSNIINTNQGKIESFNFWEKQKLAYKVKNCDEGIYLLAYFFLPAAKIRLIESELRLDKRALRQLVLKVKDSYKFKALELSFDLIKKEDKGQRSKPYKQNSENRPETKKEITFVQTDVKTEEKIQKETDRAKLKKEPKKTLEDKMEDLDKKLDAIVNDPDIMGI